MRMKLRNALIALGLAAALCVGGLTAALAASSDSDSGSGSQSDAPAATDEQPPTGERFFKRALPELTDEQKAEMQAMREKMNAAREKWDTLTQEQKDELYGLYDQAADVQSQIIDKQLELGLIDEETAQSMREMLSGQTANMRESGQMPGIGGFKGGSHGKGGPRGGERISQFEPQGGASDTASTGTL